MDTSRTTETNALGQPIGFAVPEWRPRPAPPKEPIHGRFCQIEPTSPAHAEGLLRSFEEDREGRIWTYLPYGPFDGLEAFQRWLETTCLGDDPLFHTILEVGTGRPVGVASYLRIAPATGVIEVGHINYSPPLQRTTAATEAMYLLMRRVFTELGYRRYEWKCDALNSRSRGAAERLGFTFEGVFRQATIYKGRNRDTAWYSILDHEWPAIERAFLAWFDEVEGSADAHRAGSLREHMALSRE